MSDIEKLLAGIEEINHRNMQQLDIMLEKYLDVLIVALNQGLAGLKADKSGET